jgi:XapX domain-containing protein
MKLLIALIISFSIGAVCRYFEIPVPSPPMIPGALLVLAMTVGYTVSDRVLGPKQPVPVTRSLAQSPARSVPPDQKPPL